eukprot:g59483.t1
MVEKFQQRKARKEGKKYWKMQEHTHESTQEYFSIYLSYDEHVTNHQSLCIIRCMFLNTGMFSLLQSVGEIYTSMVPCAFQHIYANFTTSGKDVSCGHLQTSGIFNQVSRPVKAKADGLVIRRYQTLHLVISPSWLALLSWLVFARVWFGSLAICSSLSSSSQSVERLLTSGKDVSCGHLQTSGIFNQVSRPVKAKADGLVIRRYQTLVHT